MRDRGTVGAQEADTLARFVRACQGPAAKALAATAEPDGDRQAHADRLVRHWRNELVPLAAIPGLGGRLGMPVRDALAGTVQGLLVVSLARLCELTDELGQVSLVATSVLGQQLPEGWAPPATEAPDGSDDDAAGDETAEAELADDAEPTAEQEDAAFRMAARRIPTAMLGAARQMWTILKLSRKRSGGRLFLRALSNLPGAGVVGATLLERTILTEVATTAYVELGLATFEPGRIEGAAKAISGKAGAATKSLTVKLPLHRDRA